MYSRKPVAENDIFLGVSLQLTSRRTIKKLALWIAEMTYVLTGDREDKAENYFKYCAPTAGADASFHQFR